MFTTSEGVYFSTIEKTRGGRIGAFKVEVDHDSSFYEGRHIGFLAHVKTTSGPKLVISVNIDRP